MICNMARSPKPVRMRALESEGLSRTQARRLVARGELTELGRRRESRPSRGRVPAVRPGLP
jgi:hypothetical protein